ncbi:MAG: hypothetical protein DHS20C01_12310 [marine bacterium B5-7]|nr:MAG: hypothetical protein DHS20C01_12310 [marine bacterium B5-7]
MKETDAIANDAPAKGKKRRFNDLLKNQFFAPPAVARSRMAICEKCEYLTSIKLCKKCNCLMPAKTNLAGTRCPEKKWFPYYAPKKSLGD